MTARSGASLVFVLTALAMISFMLLAIMTLIQAENHGSQASNQLVQVRMLSDLPEKLVISQIRRATSTPNEPEDVDPKGKLKGTEYNWASQPGLIWVFGTDHASGSPRADVRRLYKLYSSRKVVLNSNAADDSIDGPAAEAKELLGWSDNPALFTDLNEPVRAGTAQKPYFSFPILDPRAAELPVDGFKVLTTNDSSDDNVPVKAKTEMFASTGNEPKMVMPVAWLYVLQDGSIIAPDRNSLGGSADFGGGGGSGSAKPTATNPIVGRIAYWTDDDGCKLNINTATEPAPWDTPHTHTTTDESYAKSIPAKGEYYRNSGHPAYTSLSPALRHLGQGGSGTTDAKTEPANTIGDSTWQQHIVDWHQWLPHSYDTHADREKRGTEGGFQPATQAVDLKHDRLFATVDEMIYTTSTFSGTNRRAAYQDSSFNASEVRIEPDDLSRLRFFLTPHNRAPETNLFNRPKISLWPLMENEADRTVIDKKFALASSIDDHLYSFQRKTKWADDSAKGSSQEQTTDAAIERNGQLLGTLRTFTEQEIPGFGGKFVDSASSGKWTPEGRDHLLVSMLDFVRSGVNVGTPFNQVVQPPLRPQYNYLPPPAGAGIQGLGSGTSVPLQLSSESGSGGELNPLQQGDTAHTKGFGRFPTISRVALVFVAMDGTAAPATPGGAPPKTTKLQAYVVIEPFLPAPGILPASPLFSCRVHNCDQFQIDSQNLGLQREFITTFGCPPENLPSGSKLGIGYHGASVGLVSQFLRMDGTPKATSFKSLGDDVTFTAIGEVVDVPAPTPPPTPGAIPKIRFNSSGSGDVMIEIQDSAGLTVQTITVNFPATDIPIPVIQAGGRPQSQALSARIQQMLTAGAVVAPNGLIQFGDVVRSVGISRAVNTTPKAGNPNGDARIVAGRVNITPGDHLFEPHPFYMAADGGAAVDPVAEQMNALCLREGSAPPPASVGGGTGNPTQVAYGLAMSGSSGDRSSIPYHPSTLPNVPPGNIGALNAEGLPGDFDTGPGIMEDGPYIHYPDANSGANQATTGPSGTTGGYFERGGRFTEDNGATFSPWRQISSAIAFGSLPTGVYGWAGDSTHSRPWQTLLFCPNPASRTTAAGSEPDFDQNHDHFGFKTPRDHLWLEYFWMPPVEPNGLCDGYATEGKVNINYQIAPFYWIKRATAMWGALQGVRITAIPNAVVQSGQYKSPSASPFEFRYAVDSQKTLAAFDDRFYDKEKQKLDVFRSPSEICEMFLIPKQLTGADHSYSPSVPNPDNYFGDDHDAYKKALAWWKGDAPSSGFDATGDNLREAPYAQLYPRLATRSNVFTVHYRVQVLRKSRSTKPNQWVEGEDHIAAEYRGQSTIERYLDPETQNSKTTSSPTPAGPPAQPRQTIPDFAGTIDTNESLDDYYKYRVTNKRRFSP